MVSFALEVSLVPLAALMAPSQNEPDFLNRKGFHSVNVQAICNHKGNSKHADVIPVLFELIMQII